MLHDRCGHDAIVNHEKLYCIGGQYINDVGYIREYSTEYYSLAKVFANCKYNLNIYIH